MLCAFDFRARKIKVTYLIQSFLLWREEQRRWQRGGYNTKPETVELAVKLFYEGHGLRELIRRMGSPRPRIDTIWRIHRSLVGFLSEHPNFGAPKCKCGLPLWHRKHCSDRDAYHASTVAKGHATQRRLAQERYAESFFQTLNQTKQMQLLEPKSQITTFAALVQRGIDAWTEAGKLLVQMIEVDPTVRQSILEDCPDLTPETLSRFEAIGRNTLHPKTLLNSSPGMRRLRKVPMSEQSRYLTEPVPVLLLREHGTDTLRVAVKDLTAQQAQQVISPDGIRTPEAQRAWLEGRKPKVAPKSTAPYQIGKGRVTFTAGCELTAREVATILAQLA